MGFSKSTEFDGFLPSKASRDKIGGRYNFNQPLQGRTIQYPAPEGGKGLYKVTASSNIKPKNSNAKQRWHHTLERVADSGSQRVLTLIDALELDKQGAVLLKKK